MKDYSQYSYSELYGMLNHMNQFKYPDRVILLEQEIEQRKSGGTIPEKLIPSMRFTGIDFLDYFLVNFSNFQFTFSLITLGLAIAFGVKLSESHLSLAGISFAVLEVLLAGWLFYGAKKLLQRKTIGVYISFVTYLIHLLALNSFNFIFELNIFKTLFGLDTEVALVLNQLPILLLIILGVFYFFVRKVGERNMDDLMYDYKHFT